MVRSSAEGDGGNETAVRHSGEDRVSRLGLPTQDQLTAEQATRLKFLDGVDMCRYVDFSSREVIVNPGWCVFALCRGRNGRDRSTEAQRAGLYFYR